MVVQVLTSPLQRTSSRCSRGIPFPGRTALTKVQSGLALLDACEFIRCVRFWLRLRVFDQIDGIVRYRLAAGRAKSCCVLLVGAIARSAITVSSALKAIDPTSGRWKFAS